MCQKRQLDREVWGIINVRKCIEKQTLRFGLNINYEITIITHSFVGRIKLLVQGAMVFIKSFLDNNIFLTLLKLC